MTRLLQTVVDTPDVRRSSAFYKAWLGWTYRDGQAPDDDPDGEDDWVVLIGRERGERLAFQKVDQLPRSTWPGVDVPQQLHLDFLAPSREALEADRQKVLELGATLLLDRSDDDEEPLYVFADLDGHPFCIFCPGQPQSAPRG